MLFVSRLVSAAVLSVAVAIATDAGAQPPAGAAGGYDPIQAGRDAHAYHEQIRLWEVNRQLWLLDELRWRSAWPYGQPYFAFPAPGLDGIDAYGAAGPAGNEAVGRPGLAPGFAPWPYVPSSMFGYRVFGGVPQSIGQVQIQTGKNRWESHPVYPGMPIPTGSAAAPRTPLAPPPPVADEVAPRPTPPPPAAPAGRGPVEF